MHSQPSHLPQPGLPSGPPWPRHDRTPGERDDDYLVPPDPRIGQVVSAQTNRKSAGWYPMDSTLRGQRNAAGVLGFIIGGLLSAGVGAWLGELIRPQIFYGYGMNPPPAGPFDDTLRTIADILPIAGGVVGAVFWTVASVGLVYLLRRRRSSYVGTLGLQKYLKRHVLGPQLSVVRFEDCVQLNVARTRHFYNGAYTGTRYAYTLFGKPGHPAFVIDGQYNDLQPIQPSDPVRFAFAAEAAWTKFKIAQVDREIASTGMARFPVGSDWVGVGKGVIEIGWKGQTERLSTGDIQALHFETGWLVIKKKGAREGWFSSDGVFRFPVSNMANFQVFMVILEEQTGYKFK
jgi:hypothetical protein